MITIEESIAGVDQDGTVVTNWAPATRSGLLGTMERVTLTVEKDCSIHAIVCTDGSRFDLARPVHMVPDTELRFGASVGKSL